MTKDSKPSHAHLQAIHDSVCEAVDATVNGKIEILRQELRAHNAKHGADMEELKPYIQAVSGIGIVLKLFVALGSVSLAWLAIKTTFHL